MRREVWCWKGLMWPLSIICPLVFKDKCYYLPFTTRKMRLWKLKWQLPRGRRKPDLKSMLVTLMPHFYTGLSIFLDTILLLLCLVGKQRDYPTLRWKSQDSWKSWGWQWVQARIQDFTCPYSPQLPFVGRALISRGHVDTEEHSHPLPSAAPSRTMNSSQPRASPNEFCCCSN